MRRQLLIVVPVLLLAIGAATMTFSKSNANEINVPLPGRFGMPLAPEDISTIANYHIHYNLWDTLVTHSKRNGIAKAFRIENDQLSYYFEIDPAAKFSNGRPITAKDVEFSLKRLIRLGSDGHADPRALIEKIDASDPSTLLIRLKKPVSAFLYLLSLPEYGIVPSEACAEDGKIRSLAITSGAYVVSDINVEKQTLRLQQNPFFRRFIDGAPTAVNIQFERGKGNAPLIEPLVAGNASFTELIDPKFSELQDLTARSKSLDFKYTRPSLTVFMVVDSNRVPLASRLAIAKILHDAKLPLNEPLENRSYQFIPSDSFGSLDDKMLPTYEAQPKHFPQSLTLRYANSTEEIARFVARTLEASGIKVNLIARGKDEPYDIDVRSHGMNNNHPEIGLHLAALSKHSWIPRTPEVTRGLADAFHASNDEARSKALQSVGDALLSKGLIIPLTTRSYIHLYRRDSVQIDDVTTYDGDIPFYRIRVVK